MCAYYSDMLPETHLLSYFGLGEIVKSVSANTAIPVLVNKVLSEQDTLKQFKLKMEVLLTRINPNNMLSTVVFVT